MRLLLHWLRLGTLDRARWVAEYEREERRLARLEKG